jgi:hypothetical protein
MLPSFFAHVAERHRRAGRLSGFRGHGDTYLKTLRAHGFCREFPRDLALPQCYFLGMTILRDLILSICIAIGFVVAVDSLMWLWDLGANGKLVAPWLSAMR